MMQETGALPIKENHTGLRRDGAAGKRTDILAEAQVDFTMSNSYTGLHAVGQVHREYNNKNYGD